VNGNFIRRKIMCVMLGIPYSTYIRLFDVVFYVFSVSSQQTFPHLAPPLSRPTLSFHPSYNTFLILYFLSYFSVLSFLFYPSHRFFIILPFSSCLSRLKFPILPFPLLFLSYAFFLLPSYISHPFFPIPCSSYFQSFLILLSPFLAHPSFLYLY
jgi:hypothetical protein